MAHERKRSARDAAPRVYYDRGVYKGDFRRWGKGRIVLRDPDAHAWPEGGDTTEDAEVALRWALTYVDHWREDTRRQQLKLGPAPRQLGAASDEWIAQRKSGRPTTTTEGNRSALNALRRFAAEDRESGRKGDALRTDRITTALLQRFFDRLVADGYAGNTLASYRQAISAFLRSLGYRDPNAARGVDLAKLPHEEVATWNDAQLRALRKAADTLDRDRDDFGRYRLAVELALASGARRNELFALRWERIDAAARTIRITHQLDKNERRLVHPKGKRPRTALLLPSWWEHHREGSSGLILAMPDGGLPHPKEISRIAVRILTEAKLHRPGVGWHAWRHTYSRDFIELGGRFEELQKSLGHASIGTTERLYGHFHEDVAAALAGARIYRDAPIRAV
jgi:integrase